MAISKITGSGLGTIAGNVDFNGDMDVDGTANLDIVDIDGAVNMATTALVTGVLTANGGAVFNEGSADVDFRIESNGNANMLFVDGGDNAVVIGHNASRKTLFNTTATAALQVEGTTGNTSTLSIARNSNDDNGPQLVLAKSNGTAGAAVTVVTDAALLGRMSFQGADGTQTVEAARVEAFVDGTPGANDMPGRLVFSTTADGAAAVTERLRITASGRAVSQFTAQAWANINQVGTIAINDSFNISGVTDRSAGKSTFTFAVNMANDDYATSLCSANNGFQGIESQAVSNVQNANLNSSGSFEDRNNSCLIVFGDSS